MINQPLKDLHKTLGIHDDPMWTSACNGDTLKVCSCGEVWFNDQLKSESYEYLPKLWYIGPNVPDSVKEIVENMGGLGLACAVGVKPMIEVADAKEREVQTFARTLSDMITFKRHCPPSQSIPAVIAETLLQYNEYHLLFKLKELNMFQ